MEVFILSVWKWKEDHARGAIGKWLSPARNEVGQLIEGGINRDRGNVAQWLERQNSNPKTLGSMPLAILVQTSCASPPLVYNVRHAPKFCAHVKDLLSIRDNRIGFTASDMVTQKYCTRPVKTTQAAKIKIKF